MELKEAALLPTPTFFLAGESSRSTSTASPHAAAMEESPEGEPEWRRWSWRRRRWRSFQRRTARRAPWGRTLLLHPHFLLALPLSNPDPEPVGKLDVKDPGSPDLLSLVAAVTTATSQTRHPSRACTGDVQETEVKADLPRLHLTLRGSNRQ
uniref:Uncharacterized protein n=1 Tax=Oryza nivara TaxID=4536 RepID=A0A0E0HJ46_ORYNI